jgi:hypothetical protein
MDICTINALSIKHVYPYSIYTVKILYVKTVFCVLAKLVN